MTSWACEAQCIPWWNKPYWPVPYDIKRRRKTFEQEFGGRKFVRRSEIEQRALERKREEEKRELQKKSIRKRVAGGVGDGYDVLANSSDASSLPGATSKAKASSLKVRENVSDEEKIDEMVLPKAEVIRRLSYLKHPITLFGEGDDARQSRLKALLKAGVTDPDSELMEGQRNDFLVDMAELRKREKHGRLEPRKEKKRKMQRLRRTETRMARLKSNFEELCDEDKILKRTGRGKSSVATFKQCARYLKPHFKMCRKKMLPDDIQVVLMIVVKCLTMVGIHKHSAHEKIYTYSVAHIMNDETTRKYLQSIKRLMTVCQQCSLANMSDLHSLLLEESVKTGSHAAKERLLLMAAKEDNENP
ncbi:hypothetical protein CY35_17G003600 [Sphagnum magellanicum]|nr:hypothetical protein CY35_17G003600 [Sphagnum magellanicum]